MAEAPDFDCIIGGGGIAGLSLSIRLGRLGYHTAVIEKEQYPFHKLCGEYISLESLPFLEQAGFPFQDFSIPKISRFLITDPQGRQLASLLPLGGLGISRYILDHHLSMIAKKNGAEIIEQRKITDILFRQETFTVVSDTGKWNSPICCGCLGKKSVLDVKWKRRIQPRRQYIAVKYHIRGPFPRDTVSLHLFPGGYCGLCPVENGNFCLCYLSTTESLQACGNDLGQLEESRLCSNPYLKSIFSAGQKLWDRPLTISGFGFSSRPLIENHVLMLGDAAGMIPPLCGNGMSMAMHSGLIATPLISGLLEGKITRSQVELQYAHRWTETFSKRLRAGRVIQSVMLHATAAALTISLLKSLPAVTRRIITLTHGKPF
jgi:flavin-dependent dehydrogenase